jgi:hypothetical protein
MTYYQRTPSLNSDGSPLFAGDYDKASEREICAAVEAAWQCEVRPFGPLCAVDFYALRHGRMVGVLEAKTRSHQSDRYATVFLNVRKWLALSLYQNGLGVPAVYVVRFTDEIRFVRVCQIDASRWVMGGTKGVVKSHTDVEPLIEVPISSMTILK